MTYIGVIVIATETIEDPISNLFSEESTPIINGLVKNPHNFKNREKREKFSFGGSSQVTHGISARIQKNISLYFSQFLKRMCYNAVEESTQDYNRFVAVNVFPDWRRKEKCSSVSERQVSRCELRNVTSCAQKPITGNE